MPSQLLDIYTKSVFYDSDKKLSRNIFHELLSPDYCIIDGEILAGNMSDNSQRSRAVLYIFANINRSDRKFIAVKHAFFYHIEITFRKQKFVAYNHNTRRAQTSQYLIKTAYAASVLINNLYLIASLIDMLIMDVIGVAYGAGIMYGYMHLTTGAWEFLMAMLLPRREDNCDVSRAPPSP